MANPFITTEKLLNVFLENQLVITDSRQVIPGCLFFALKGEKFDGNVFAEQALQQGASFAIVDDASIAKNERYLLVRDTLIALQQLAKAYRQLFQIPVLAITGSNGKTTTKELVHAVLTSHFKTHATKGNFNNHVGVPLTLLAMQREVQFAVVEMGANHPGEIDTLCQIANPTYGLITNVGKAHLEGFGGFEGVKNTKSELYRFLQKNNGVVFINSDEEYLTDLAKDCTDKVIYGQNPGNSRAIKYIELQCLNSTPFVSSAFKFDDKLIRVESNLTGKYNFGNIATAIAVGVYFGVPAQKIKQAIESYLPSNNRSQFIKKGTNTYLLDAYNANPTSVRNALQSFSVLESPKKWVILGAMKELGIYSEEEHKAITYLALACHFEEIILVGKEFEKCAKSNGLLWFDETNSLKIWFNQNQPTDAHILIKGSRSVGLEKLLQFEK